MANIVGYVMSAHDTFSERPLCRVDSLVFCWLAYLRFARCDAACTPDGMALADFSQAPLRLELARGVHDERTTSLLLASLAASPRFADVRACRHVAESSAEEPLQFSATTFVLPDGQSVYVAFRGTDDSLTGWKENLRLACATPVPAQERARTYVEELAVATDRMLWVGGHSKGGVLAAYACGTAAYDVRLRIACCFSHDGPGVSERVRTAIDWHDDVPVYKTVAGESLVGLVFERSERDLAVVRSDAVGFFQHDPLSWEVRGHDFACRHGVAYDSWRVAQRLNDWLDGMQPDECERFVELLSWMVDATGETSFSGLVRRWPSNREAMQTALSGAGEDERELFACVMDDLVTTILLGSEQEYAPVGERPQERADAAERRIEDLSAHMLDRLDEIDRLAGL